MIEDGHVSEQINGVQNDIFAAGLLSLELFSGTRLPYCRSCHYNIHHYVPCMDPYKVRRCLINSLHSVTANPVEDIMQYELQWRCFWYNFKCFVFHYVRVVEGIPAAELRCKYFFNHFGEYSLLKTAVQCMLLGKDVRTFGGVQAYINDLDSECPDEEE